MDTLPSKTFRIRRISRKSTPKTPLGQPNRSKTEITRYSAGFDVHRDNIAVCVCAQTAQNEIITIRQHTFRNLPPDLVEMTQFLSKYQPVAHYLMECTSIYHRPVYAALKKAFPDRESKIIAMNPLLVHRKITDLGNKHDKADAQRMAELAFYDRLLRPSYVGDAHFFHLRDTLRNYEWGQRLLTRLKNRIHRILCSFNFMYKFNLNNEWALLLLDHWIYAGGTFKSAFSDLIVKLIKEKKSIKVLKKQSPHFKPYETVELPEESRFNLKVLLQQFLEVDRHVSQYITQAESLILQDEEFKLHYETLLRIPCLGQTTALVILTEIGNFRRFRNWRAFAKFCGVVPEMKETGDNGNKGHVNRFTNPHLRTALVQVGGLIVNGMAEGTDLGNYAYRQRSLRHLPFKKASLKLAFKLSHIIYNSLVKGITYDPHYEQTQRKMKRLSNRHSKSGTMLESNHTRGLRRDVSKFLVNYHEDLNSRSRFLLTRGFKELIRKKESKSKTPSDHASMDERQKNIDSSP